jgi:beta-mannanase
MCGEEGAEVLHKVARNVPMTDQPTPQTEARISEWVSSHDWTTCQNGDHFDIRYLAQARTEALDRVIAEIPDAIMAVEAMDDIVGVVGRGTFADRLQETLRERLKDNDRP